MIKKYLGITLISATIAIAGCSSNDDDDGVLGDITDPITGGNEEDNGDGGDGDGGDAVAGGGVIEVPTEFTPGEGVTLSLVETLTNAGTFNTLLQAVSDAGLAQTLADSTGATLFAPTDEVLAGVTLPTDQAELSNLLQGHVVSGFLDGALVANSVGSTATALNGDALAITADGGNLFVSGIQITGTDTQATNGIIHTIGGVIGSAPAGGEGDGGEGEGEGDGGEGDGGGVVAPGGTDLGASLNNLNSLGFTDYVTIHNSTDLGTVYDANGWTAFIPTNDAIPDDALASDATAARAIAVNHIVTERAIEFEDLSSTTDIPATNGGVALTFGGTPEAPTVNGFTITEISSPGNANLYEIDGLLQ